MDWDLNAIVRSCSTSAAPPSITSKSTTPTDQNTQAAAAAAIENGNFDTAFDYLAALTFDNEEDDPFGFSDLVQPKNNNGLQELHNSCIPFLPNPTGTEDKNNSPDSSISDFGAFCGPIQPLLAQSHFLPPPPPTTDTPIGLRFDYNQQQQLHQQISHRPERSNIVLPIRSTQSSASRFRKKKSSQKKLVMQVAAENLCSDVWAWRKYGQKPIKGSPYPRNYYRCSSSKGCTARKQVERSNTDPNMFTVSYTGDHTHPRPTHRNSLAGSVRNKFPTNQNPASNESAAPTIFEKEINGLSPTTPLSASMAHDAANESLKGEISNMDEVDDQMEVNGELSAGEGVDDDEIEVDGGGILIPNIMALDEDLLKGLQQLGAAAGDGVFGTVGRSNSDSSRRSLGRSPDFGNNFSN